MLMRKGFSFKLTPDGAQARKMSRFAGCARFVYNKGIAWNEEQRNTNPNFRISYKKRCQPNFRSGRRIIPGWQIPIRSACSRR